MGPRLRINLLQCLFAVRAPSQYAMSLITNPKPGGSDAIELVQARVRRETEENMDDAGGTNDDDICADVRYEGDGDK